MRRLRTIPRHTGWMGDNSRISIDEFVRSRHLLIDRLEFRDDVRLLKPLGIRWNIIASKLD
jgi:hypothetical protein